MVMSPFDVPEPVFLSRQVTPERWPEMPPGWWSAAPNPMGAAGSSASGHTQASSREWSGGSRTQDQGPQTTGTQERNRSSRETLYIWSLWKNMFDIVANTVVEQCQL